MGSFDQHLLIYKECHSVADVMHNYFQKGLAITERRLYQAFISTMTTFVDVTESSV
jgi:RNA polymerase-interacting CarD/CdnL/TRCF family regulator